jgi:hypothetical protein
MLIKPMPSQAVLPFSISNIDVLFPGFAAGDFGVLYGTPTVLLLSLLLCVRAQLPLQLGGLETNVVFVDGGNTFRLYKVSRIAQLHHLCPKQVLERIYISRAFTAYQMASIIFEKLEETVSKYSVKLVIVSDIAGLYLDRDIPMKEANQVFSQLTVHLSKLADEHQIIVVATCLPHYCSRRNTFFHAVVSGRANLVASVRSTKSGQEFVLEKHRVLNLGRARFPSGHHTLNQFMES